MRRERWEQEPELIFEAVILGRVYLRRLLLEMVFPNRRSELKGINLQTTDLLCVGLQPWQAADWLAYEVFLAT